MQLLAREKLQSGVLTLGVVDYEGPRLLELAMERPGGAREALKIDATSLLAVTRLFVRLGRLLFEPILVEPFPASLMPGVADVLVASEPGDRRGFRLVAEADQLLAALTSPDPDAPVRSEDVRLFLGFADRPNDLLRPLSGPGLSLHRPSCPP